MRSCLQIWMWWYPVSSPGHHSSPALCRWDPELSFLMLPAGLRLAMPAVCVYTCTCTQLQVTFWESGHHTWAGMHSTLCLYWYPCTYHDPPVSCHLCGRQRKAGSSGMNVTFPSSGQGPQRTVGRQNAYLLLTINKNKWNVEKTGDALFQTHVGDRVLSLSLFFLIYINWRLITL